MVLREHAFTVLNSDNNLLSCLISSNRPIQHGDPITLLCHGHTSSKRSAFLSALTTHLLSLYPPNHAIARFDFSGNGASQGHFSYANYRHEAADICAVVRHLHNELGLQVTTVAGHSKGATSALLFAASHDEARHLPTLICLAGRWRMDRGIIERFGDEALSKMKRGHNIRIRTKRCDGDGNIVLHEYDVTYAHIQERVATDVKGAVARLPQGLRVLTVHGDADATIPVQDGRDFHAAVVDRGLHAVLNVVDGGAHSFEGMEQRVARAVARFCGVEIRED